LHGWGSSSAAWETIGDFFISSGYDVIIPDLPGFGDSAPPPAAWGTAEYADWVHELLGSLGIQTCCLVGHSFGGRLTIKYTAGHADRICGIVLVAAAGIKPADLNARIKKVTFQQAAKVGKGLFRLPIMRLFAAPARKILYRAAREHDYEKAEGIMKEVLARVVQEDLQAELGQIAVPALLLWGAQDSLTPLADGERMQALLTHSRLQVFPKAGHALYKQFSDEVCREINSFISPLAR